MASPTATMLFQMTLTNGLTRMATGLEIMVMLSPMTQMNSKILMVTESVITQTGHQITRTNGQIRMGMVSATMKTHSQMMHQRLLTVMVMVSVITQTGHPTMHQNQPIQMATA